MFAAALRGTGRHSRRTRLRATATGVAAVAVAALLAACGGESSSDANEPAGTYDVRVTEAELPRPSSASARPRCCGSASATPARRRCRPDRDDHDRRQGRARLLAAVRHPRPAGRPRPARPAGLGAGRRPTRAWPAPPTRAAPRPRTRKTFAFGPLKPGETTEGGLEAERGQSRQVHRSRYNVDAGLGGRREGGDRRRRRPGRLLRRPRSPPSCRTPKSPTTAKSSKSSRQAREPGE